MSINRFLSAALFCAVLVASHVSNAHSGRRLVVEVVNGKLQTQGLNTGPSDGAPAIRPYLNSIHDHWGNVDALGIATATLPGFDIPPSAALAGQDLELELRSVTKWVSPPPMPSPSVIPNLQPLDPGQLITVDGATDGVDSDGLGSITLFEDVPINGVTDLDLNYGINELPSGEIHVLRFILSATPNGGGAPSLEPSDPIHILLSPDGVGPLERLHHASLFLEQYVTTIPEPSAFGEVVLAFACRTLGRKRV